jgi:glycosyltransferase involved in cell wall biosynthesis
MALTVGIPVYNEEDILEANTARLVEHLRARGEPFEIILGSNGSTDRTVALGERLEAEWPEVRFFHLPKPGVGLAFRHIARHASYDALVSLDMDLSVDLAFVDEAVRQLTDHDIVVGSKFTGRQQRSWFRRLGSGLFVALASTLLDIEFVDFSIGAKAYRLSAIRPYASLVSEGSAYVLDLVYYVHRDGGRVVQVPVSCEDHRESKFHLGREAVHKFANLGRLWWRRHAQVR